MILKESHDFVLRDFGLRDLALRDFDLRDFKLRYVVVVIIEALLIFDRQKIHFSFTKNTNLPPKKKNKKYSVFVSFYPSILFLKADRCLFSSSFQRNWNTKCQLFSKTNFSKIKVKNCGFKIIIRIK